MTARFTIPVAPRTKKTSDRLDLRGPKPKKLPSKSYEKWFTEAMTHAPDIRQKLAKAGLALPISVRVTVSAKFYLDAAYRSDVTGLQQALADWMQAPRWDPPRNGAGIIEDDFLINPWGRAERFVDRENPRIEVTIRVVEEVAGA